LRWRPRSVNPARPSITVSDSVLRARQQLRAEVMRKHNRHNRSAAELRHAI
jgi:hypothetical protein